MSFATMRRLWDAHHDCTAKLTKLLRSPEDEKAERQRVYLRAEKEFYDAWQAVDRESETFVPQVSIADVHRARTDLAPHRGLAAARGDTPS